MKAIASLFIFFATTLFAQTPEIVVQTGHGINPTVVTFSSDGKLLATGGKDKQIKIWDVQTGQLIRTFNSYDAVSDLAFFPDNDDYLISVSSGKNTGYPLYVWNTKLGGYSDQEEVAGGLKNIILANRGALVVTPSLKGPLEYWIPGSEAGTYDFYQTVGADWENMKDIVVAINASASQLMLFTTVDETQYVGASVPMGDVPDTSLNYQVFFDYPLRKLLFTGDEKYLVGLGGTNPSDSKVIVMDAATGNKLAELDAAEYCLNEIAQSMIFIDHKGVIGNFNFSDMKTSGNIIDDKHKYTIVAASPTGDRFSALDQNGNLRIWEYPSGKLINEIKNIPPRNNVLFDPLGRFVVFDGENGQLVKWEMESGSIEVTKPHRAPIEHIEISDDGKWLATAGLDSTVKLFDLEKDSLRMEIKVSTPHINSIDINHYGNYMSVAYLDTFFNYNIETDSVYPASGVGSQLSYYGIGYGDTIFYYIYDNRYFYVLDMNSNYLASLDYVERIEKPALSYGNKYFAFVCDDDTLKLFQVATGNLFTTYIHNHESITALVFTPDNQFLYVGHGTGYINTLNLETGQWGTQLNGHKDAVRSLSYYAEKNMLASSGNDGTIVLWDLNKMQRIATLYAFPDGTWAVIDEEGRYDASNAGVIDYLHFVNGREVIDLYQLKERYYEPGLLQKLLGYNTEPVRDVAVFDDLALYPDVISSLKTNPELTLDLTLVKRSGGYGRVQVFINDKEVIEDAAKGKIDESKDTVNLEVPLKSFSQFILSGTENKIGVKVFNKEGYLSSRYYTLSYKPEKLSLNISKTPHLYAVVAGTSNYRGEKLDLKFADEDAAAMSEALTTTAAMLLGKANVHVKLFNTSALQPESLPTKDNIKKALEEFSVKALPGDIVLVYFSGHGVSYGDAEGMFYYLTSGVESGDIKDEAIRNQYTISTNELTDWLKKIPAQKQVMIIDACSSGKLVEDILAMKSVPSNQIRAIERLKDRTGTFIIAGSASDMVSYEASQFGQSLLTYSLLLGMSGAALRENEFVDVMTMFQYAADRVPEFAKYIGGVQKPVVFAPYQSASFDIGRVTSAVHIPVANIKPLFVRSNFQQEDFPYDDILALSEKLNSKFNEIASKGKDASMIYVDTKPYPNSYSITGRYNISNGKISLRGGLIFKDESGVSKPMGAQFVVERPEDEAALLADDVLLKVQELVK